MMLIKLMQYYERVRLTRAYNPKRCKLVFN